MNLFRFSMITGTLLMAAVCAKAEKADGMIITVNARETSLTIADISEVLFSDDALTVVKTDSETLTFTGDWALTFGEVDTNGISTIEFSTQQSQASIYDSRGVLVKEVKSIIDADINSLPTGIYIITIGNKTIKISK